VLDKSKWIKLSREERADVVKELHKEYTIRKIAEIIPIAKSTVEKYLIYSRFPEELREEYGFLGLNVFARVFSSGGDLRKGLEAEKIKQKYNRQRRRDKLRYVRLEKLQEQIGCEPDKRKLYGLLNKRDRLLLELCPPSSPLINLEDH
jgi:transposase